ncbi:uncharacterized protein LOC128859329 isoform X2 [Anastrepha ludens]|uniref:uncharacterized protein LOC128859329 isoform X2 n=1 Tax=Anastrepha ludens TaxID=28586 RepID=UPI0023B0AB75|nr:uncharacterized protein LOC128859329 isoform X2 [Anastrepha ludens]
MEYSEQSKGNCINFSTTSTIVAQPTTDNNSAGVFTSTTVVPIDTDGANSETITTIIKTTTVTEKVAASSE